eukprot:TRINITY_DN5785_c0_g1_i1.p1 TRINITY_DN5785_c0_g1~~TRINITY_DN5785_c0_g1_i1.p1  ORF type:complete len:1237 (+),score=171.78 TRINITY_DN5785_c0_g1_i1:705-4415(+)
MPPSRRSTTTARRDQSGAAFLARLRHARQLMDAHSDSGSEASGAESEDGLIDSAGAKALEKQGVFDASIDLKKLKQLKRMFETADTDKGGDLDEAEFLAAFRPVVGNTMTDDQLRVWFSKIDFNANGYVDWSEFSTYVLLEGQQGQLQDGVKYEYVKTSLHMTNRPELWHRDMVTTLLVHPRLNRYYTCSRDGMVKMWNSGTLKFEGILHNAGAWCTDACLSKSGNRIMVTSVDRMVWVFECGDGKIHRTFMGKGKHAKDVKEPVKRRNLIDNRKYGTDLDFEMGQLATKRNPQQYGDTFDEFRENMNSTRFTNTIGSQTVESIVLRNLADAPMAIEHFPTPNKDLMVLGCRNGVVELYNINTSKPYIDPTARFSAHDASVSRIRSSEHLQGIITASWDCYVKIINLETGQIARTLGTERQGHHKSIFSLDWNEPTKVLASCGAERHIFIWNPFISKPVFKLEGHAAPMVSVVFNETGQTLLSMCSNKVIKLWDTRTFKCIQTVQDHQHYWPEDCTTAVAWDSRRQSIVTGTTHPVVWQIRRAVTAFDPSYNGHSKHVVRCLYNANLNQIVSADAETVIVWDLLTGERVAAFAPRNELPNPTDMLSDIRFDSTNRRLLTGTHNGQVTMWNYINGTPINMYEKPSVADGVEISCVLHVMNVRQEVRVTLAVAGTNICIWKDSDSLDAKLFSVFQHSLNLISAVELPDVTVGFGSDSGQIALFNAVTFTDLGVMGDFTPLQAVEDLVYLPLKVTVLVSGVSTGYLQFWCLRTRTLLYQFLGSDVADRALTRIATDSRNTLIGCADDFGDITVYTMNFQPRPMRLDPPNFHKTLAFNAHEGVVTGICIVGQPELIVSSGIDCSVKVHTLKGEYVGYMGQRLRWQLGLVDTYAGEARAPTADESKRKAKKAADAVSSSLFLDNFRERSASVSGPSQQRTATTATPQPPSRPSPANTAPRTAKSAPARSRIHSEAPQAYAEPFRPVPPAQKISGGLQSPLVVQFPALGNSRTLYCKGRTEGIVRQDRQQRRIERELSEAVDTEFVEPVPSQDGEDYLQSPTVARGSLQRPPSDSGGGLADDSVHLQELEPPPSVSGLSASASSTSIDHQGPKAGPRLTLNALDARIDQLRNFRDPNAEERSTNVNLRGTMTELLMSNDTVLRRSRRELGRDTLGVRIGYSRVSTRMKVLAPAPCETPVFSTAPRVTHQHHLLAPVAIFPNVENDTEESESPESGNSPEPQE